MRIEWPAPNRRFGALDALAVLGLVGLLVARFVPVARLPFWGCAFREMTGWPCPGCGLTRAADRVSHFNFAGAWDANPLGTIAAAAFMVVIVLSAFHLAFRMPLPTLQLTAREKTAGSVGLAALVVLNWSWMLAGG